MKTTKISMLLVLLFLSITSSFVFSLPTASTNTVEKGKIDLRRYYHYTVDYWMCVSDVQFNLNEIIVMNDEQIKQKIIDRSEIVVEYQRPDLVTYNVKTSDLDISNLKRESSTDGMRVTFTFPSITGGVVSQISILVYVVDDREPEKTSSSSMTAPSISIKPSSTFVPSSKPSSSSSTITSSTSTQPSSSGSAVTPNPSTSSSSMTTSASSIIPPSTSSSQSIDSKQTKSSVSSSTQEKATTAPSSTKKKGDNPSPKEKAVIANDLEREQIAHYAGDEQEESKVKVIAKKITTASLSIVDILIVIAIILDIRVLLWYRKRKKKC